MKRILLMALFAVLNFGMIACSKQDAPQSEIKRVDTSMVGTDLLKAGSLKVSEVDYASIAYKDNEVLPASSSVLVDIRGRLYLPEGEGPFPLVVLLHGNHATCGLETGAGNPRLDISVDYALAGKCKAGYVESPSHLGYADTAKLLGSKGIAVISVNANRGITGLNGSYPDSGLVYARGALVLRHIEELHKWSTTGQSAFLKPSDSNLAFKNKINFGQVGLMGHSRGGEGVRHAFNIYNYSSNAAAWKAKIPGLSIKGIFEIAPVDFGTSDAGKIEAKGTAWNVLLAGCDQDVYDFQGVGPFSRMLEEQEDGLSKSVFTVWGANHNYFNSEWHVSDAPHTCIGSQVPLWNTRAPAMPAEFARFDANARAGLKGSKAQIDISRALMSAFFQAHLKGVKELEHVFDPQYRLPSQLAALAPNSREYLGSPEHLVAFDAKEFATLQADNLTIKYLKNFLASEIDELTKSWKAYSPSYSATLQTLSYIRPAVVITGAQSSNDRSADIAFNSPQDTSDFWTIDLSLAIRKACNVFNSQLENTCGAFVLNSDIDVALVLADDSVTPSVKLRDYVQLNNWYDHFFEQLGTQGGFGGTKVVYLFIPVLYQTARFELTDFGSFTGKVKGVRLTFPANTDVSLLLEAIRLSKKP